MAQGRPFAYHLAMGISDRLIEVANHYHREARKCAKARAYLAACVMQASALEAGLHAMCFLFPEQVKKSTVYQKKKFKRKRSRALDFKYYELINIADELSWFPQKRVTFAGSRATLAGFVHGLRDLRNHVHGSVWAPKRPETLRFTSNTYKVAYEVFDVANLWLLHRVRESLRKSFEREDRLLARNSKKP